MITSKKLSIGLLVCAFSYAGMAHGMQKEHCGVKRVEITKQGAFFFLDSERKIIHFVEAEEQGPLFVKELAIGRRIEEIEPFKRMRESAIRDLYEAFNKAEASGFFKKEKFVFKGALIKAKVFAFLNEKNEKRFGLIISNTLPASHDPYAIRDGGD